MSFQIFKHYFLLWNTEKKDFLDELPFNKNKIINKKLCDKISFM